MSGRGVQALGLRAHCQLAHFLLLPPPSLFSFRVPPKPGTAGPPLQPNPFILLSLEHFGLLRWLRRKNLPAVQETWVDPRVGKIP